MPRIPAGDIQLNCEVYGQGEPLVLIPGFRIGLWLWFKQIEAFARKYQTIVFDPRGIGESDALSGPVSVKSLADDLAGLLRALGIEQAHILGASFGGFVAQEFAIAYPRMTRSLTLCCTSFGGPRHLLPSVSTLQAFAATEGLNSEEMTRNNFKLAFAPAFINGKAAELEQVVKLRLSNPVSDQTHFAQLQAAATFDTEAQVAQIKAPTLVITGDEDILVPPDNSHSLAKQIAGARLVIIKGGSHMFFIEQAERFNSAVIDFIDRVSLVGNADKMIHERTRTDSN
jgi:pimeloyl-ACP methyl ester carboxylesterase